MLQPQPRMNRLRVIKLRAFLMRTTVMTPATLHNRILFARRMS